MIAEDEGGVNHTIRKLNKEYQELLSSPYFVYHGRKKFRLVPKIKLPMNSENATLSSLSCKSIPDVIKQDKVI